MTGTKMVTNTAAADFLTSPNMRFLLGPFMQGETTMSEAASVLGMELNTFYRRIQQIVTLNLDKVARGEVRHGRRIKLYRATSRESIVPIGATTSVNLETYLDDVFRGSVAILSRGVARAMELSAPHWGFGIHLTDTGGVFQHLSGMDEHAKMLVPEVAVSPSWYGDAGVRLKPEAARNFRRELQGLYESYFQQAEDEGEGEWYFFFAGFTPT